MNHSADRVGRLELQVKLLAVLSVVSLLAAGAALLMREPAPAPTTPLITVPAVPAAPTATALPSELSVGALTFRDAAGRLRGMLALDRRTGLMKLMFFDEAGGESVILTALGAPRETPFMMMLGNSQSAVGVFRPDGYAKSPAVASGDHAPSETAADREARVLGLAPSAALPPTK